MDRQATQSLPSTFIAGALIGVLGGMIGLGGAEFRLPLLIGVLAALMGAAGGAPSVQYRGHHGQ